jgi:tetratricopeptide (TPR) repeat protein
LFIIAGNSLSLAEDNPQANRTTVERLLMAAVTNRHPWPKDYYLGSAFFNLAEIWYRQNRMEDAASALKKAAALIPRKYDARLGLARIYINLNKIEEAEEQIKWLESRRLDPDRLIILSKLRQEMMIRQTVPQGGY